MKKILLFITLIIVCVSQAQIVNIPDTNFKNTLLTHTPVIDTNADSEIQVTEAEAVTGLIYLCNKSINDLTGISSFINITGLDCSVNSLSTLDISTNTALTELICSHNNLSTLDVSTNTALTELICFENSLSTLDVNTNTALTNLLCYNNNLSTLNVSTNTALTHLSCGGNYLSTLDVSTNTALTHLSCYSNNLSTLDVSTNTALTHLSCYSNNLSTLDVSNNTTLTELSCSENSLSTLNVSNNTALTWLWCFDTNLSTLDVSANTALTGLNCSENSLLTLDVSTNTALTQLFCSYNELSTLDISINPDLYKIICNGNTALNYINLKNGNNVNFSTFYCNFENLPYLESVCVDDTNSDLVTLINDQVGHAVIYTEYCSLIPAQSNEIVGNTRLDTDANGCDSSDLPMSNLMLMSDNGTDRFATFTQSDGNYLLYTNEGTFVTAVSTNLPAYFTVNPNEHTNIFTGFDNTFTADFCIEPNQTVNDINISLIPTSQARSGFNVTYQIVYKNVGTTQLNGNITLEFDETKLSFLNASETVNTQTSNSLTFDYINLNPFETRIIDLEFNVFAPPTVEIGDNLTFTTTINPITDDTTPDNNIFTLEQTVIGSYDPNDITCLEGDVILLEDIDKYLHYVIRFQNTGTASAINVVITNVLDSKLDWTTLQLLSSSHNNRVAIQNGNEIEFIFENINLPDSTSDELNSHGFIAYKIKPKTDIALGDIIPDKADIFFDYNEAIETNTVTTEIANTVSINENRLSNFSIYPIPTENILNIISKAEIAKIIVYSKLGQLILKNERENKIDITDLTQGIYFIKVEDLNGNFGVKKVIKK